MTINSRVFVSVLLAFAFLPTTAVATSHPPAAASGFYNGHFYEVIAYPDSGHPDKTWPVAESAAIARTFEYETGLFINGHLATITSSGEDAFIESLRVEAGLHPFEAWVGGFQNSPPCGSEDCNWTWVNGEGLFIYTNWQSGEPNDAGGEEQYLGIGLGDVPGWNDERALGNIGGYVVEYDVPIPATECVAGSEGCPISEASTVTFPPSVELEPDAQIDVRRFEFTDDLSTCGVAPRTIFGPTTDPDNLLPDAVIPAYLCGSPKFQVIIADTEGVTIPSGTILVENQTSDVFPDNLYDCTGPLAPDASDPLLDPDDPQNRDVMAWQTTDLTKMPENDVGVSFGDPYEGSVGEFTFECGSSRGKGNFGSLYFVGLHIDFGPDYADYSMNPDGVNTQFALLTRYKLFVLKDVILESKVALKDYYVQRAGFWALKRLVNVAIRKHDNGRYYAALWRLRIIDAILQVLPYTEIPGENYQGETEMRNSNGIFMYTDKVIQTTP